MKKSSSKTLIIVLLSLVIIYMIFRYVIPRLFAYVFLIFAFIPPLISSIAGIAVIILIFYFPALGHCNGSQCNGG